MNVRHGLAARWILGLLASLALSHGGELHQAVRACDQNRVRQLLSERPSLNTMDENGLTPLHIAIDSDHKACVWILLEAGADRTARDRRGRTPLEAAEKITDPQDRAAVVYMLRSFGLETPEKPGGPMPWTLEYTAMHRQLMS